MKFPETVLITAPAMGEFGSPSDSSASISTRSRPTGAGLAALELRLDLRARAVHQHYADAGAVQKVDVVREFDELALGEYFSAEGEYECLAAERVEIGGDGAEPTDELGVGVGRHGYRCFGEARF